jgi:hypothetical protein
MEQLDQRVHGDNPLAGRALAGAALFALVAAAGPACSSGQTSRPTTSPVSRIKVFAEDSGGRELSPQTVSVRVGSALEVNLESLYWQLDTIPDPRTLALQKQVTTDAILLTAGQQSCTASVPGSGCGTRTLTFEAVAAGTVLVHATRTSCGEALRCAPGQQSFTLTVNVRR